MFFCYGLRTIAEPMYSHFAGIIMLCKNGDMDADSLLNLLQVPEGVVVRETFKRTFKALRDKRRGCDDLPYIDVYPNDPEDLKDTYPDVYNALYPIECDDPAKGPVPSQVNHMTLDALRERVPCRSTSKLISMARGTQESWMVSDVVAKRMGRPQKQAGQLINILAGLAKNGFAEPRPEAATPEEDVLPGLKLFMPGAGITSTPPQRTSLLSTGAPSFSRYNAADEFVVPRPAEQDQPLDLETGGHAPDTNSQAIAPIVPATMDINAMAQNIINTMAQSRQARKDQPNLV